MDESDRKRFAELMTAVSEAMGKTMSTPLLRIWWNTLKHRSYEDVERALHQHLQDPDRCHFMPKPGDVNRQLEGPGDSRAYNAWSKVEKAIERHGPWGCLAFDDPAIHAVIEDMGGWKRLCAVTYDELPHRRHEFCKRWMQYLNHPPANYPPLIVGDGGREFDAPVALIGDRAKAKQVMESEGGERVQITNQADGGAGPRLPEPDKAS